MNSSLYLLLTGLFYPGLGTALLLGMAYRFIGGKQPGIPPLEGVSGALRTREGLVSLFSIVAVSAGLLLLPWPYHLQNLSTSWLYAWFGFELAFLLPLLPALSSGSTPHARAAIRSAQVGALARALLWAAIGIGFMLQSNWQPLALPAHLLTLIAALLAFPIAIGWGVFADELTVTPAGVQAGLPQPVEALNVFAHQIRSASLLAALLLATLPVFSDRPWLGLLTMAAGFISVGALLRRLNGRLPRLPLTVLLRFGWLVVGGFTTAATIAFVILQ